MNIRSFDEFESYSNGNEDNILGRIQILTNESVLENSPFIKVTSMDEAQDLPILVCGDFEWSAINESGKTGLKVYNSYNIKTKGDLLKKFVGESFIPKMVKDRSKAKKLSFPIVASGKKGSTTYNTPYMFNKSENNYVSYQEKIIPKTKYDVLMFKNKPICVYEKINDTFKDRGLKSKIVESAIKIAKKILESHGMDAYKLKIYESNKGGHYLGGIHKCSDLNERQSNLLYIALYEDHYGYAVPTWFKNKINSIDVNN